MQQNELTNKNCRDAEGLFSVIFNLISQGDGEIFLDQQMSILRQTYLIRTRNDAVPMNSLVDYKIAPADQKFHNESLVTQLLRFKPFPADKDREAEMLLLEINDIITYVATSKRYLPCFNIKK